MIPAPFDYVRPGSVPEAVEALAEHGDEAKLLAGGHSLLPLMKLRLAAPEVVVDLGRVEELRGVGEVGDGRLAIGPMTTHHEVVGDPLVRRHCGVLADVAATVGDAQVRHRGTLGGALAHGDAASDLPAVLVALGGSLVVQGPEATREIEAGDFFVDYLTTALAEDELVVEVRMPKMAADWTWHYEKFNRVAQSWAIVGSLAMIKRDHGRIRQARVGLTNVATTPVRAHGVEEALAGATPEAIDEAAERAAEGTRPPGDLNASPEYREHLARLVSTRALQAAWG